MLRVLHCIYDDPANPWVAGGGSVRVLELYRRLIDRVGSVTVATGSYAGARNQTIDGIQYVRLGAASPYVWSRLSYSAAATWMLARAEYDVAVVDFSTYAPVRIPRNRPVGLTVHHVTGATARVRFGPLVGRFVETQEIRRLRHARYLSATSQITYQRLRQLLGAGVDIRLIEAGVPDELFALQRRESDYLLFFGRLDWFQKGLDVLLDAMARLVRARPELRLKIAGRGRDGARVLERAHSLGIRENVELIGAVEPTVRNELFSGAKVLLMPSRFEGFGMVAAEAMAAGIPVVGSDAGSLPEVIDPPAGGLVVPSSDAGALAAAVDGLLRDRTGRRSLSVSARASAQRFRWDRIANQHLDFLEAIRSDSRTTKRAVR